jgi:hypothetical protein
MSAHAVDSRDHKKDNQMELNEIHALLSSEAVTIADLEKGLAALSLHDAALARELGLLKNKRQELLLAGDDKSLAKTEAELATVDRRNERLAALADALQKKIVRTREADDLSKLDALRMAAMQKRDVAEKMLTDRYPSLCREMLSILGAIAESDEAVDAFNKIASGKDALQKVEHVIRSGRHLPEEIIDTEIRDLWCDSHTSQPLPDDLQHRVVDQGGALGLLHGNSGIQRNGPQQVVRLRYEVIKYKQRRHVGYKPPLAELLSLPELTEGSPAYWRPNEFHGARQVIDHLKSFDTPRAPSVDTRPVLKKLRLIPVARENHSHEERTAADELAATIH